MKARIAFSVVAIGLALWLLSKSLESPPWEAMEPVDTAGAEDVEPAAKPSAPPEAADSPSADRASLTAEAVTPEPVETVHRLSGIVRLAEDETPVANVEVALYWEGYGWGFDSATRTQTGEDGRFQVELPESRTLVRAIVEAGPTTTLTSTSVRRRVEGSEESIELVVSSGATLRGFVVDVEGQRVAGAHVSGWCSRYRHEGSEPDRRTTSAEDGSFGLHGLGAGVVLRAQTESLVSYNQIVGDVEPGRVAQGLELVVGPGLPLNGRVTDEQGRPLEGLTVQVGTYSGSSGEPTGERGLASVSPRGLNVETDAAGRFETPSRALLDWGVNVYADGFRQWNQRHNPSDGPLEIVLDQGVVVRGRVVGPSGPLAGAEVSVRGAGNSDDETDVDGLFEITGLEEPEHGTLHVHAAGHAIHVQRLVGEIDWTDPDSATGWTDAFGPRPEGNLWFDVSLDPGLALAGRVVDVDANPIFGSRVTIVGDHFYPRSFSTNSEPTWEWSLGLSEVTTDEEGRFRFDDLYDGEFEIHAADVNDSELDVRVTKHSGSVDIEIVFDPKEARGVVFQGRVTDALTGEPVPSFRLRPMIQDADGMGSFGSSHARTSEDGSFVLAGYDPARIQLEVLAPGYAPWKAERKAYEVGEHHFDVRLAPARRLDLRVVDFDGAPYKNTGVRVLDANDGEVWIAQGGSTTNRGRTNHDGFAYLEPLPAGPITVFIAHAGGEAEFPIDVTRPIEGTYEVELERVEPVEVHVGAVLVSLPADAEPKGYQHVEGTEGLSDLLAVLPLDFESTQPEDFLGADSFAAELIDAAGEVHGTSSGRRRSDRTWRTKSRYHKGGSTNPSSQLAMVSLRASYPEFPLRLAIEVEGHESLDETLRVSAEEPEALLVVYIRRSE